MREQIEDGDPIQLGAVVTRPDIMQERHMLRDRIAEPDIVSFDQLHQRCCGQHLRDASNSKQARCGRDARVAMRVVAGAMSGSVYLSRPVCRAPLDVRADGCRKLITAFGIVSEVGEPRRKVVLVRDATKRQRPHG